MFRVVIIWMGIIRGGGGGVTMAEFDRWEFSGGGGGLTAGEWEGGGCGGGGGGWQPFSFFYKALRLFVCFYP